MFTLRFELQVGTWDKRNSEFEEIDSYDLEEGETVNEMLNGGVDSDADYARLVGFFGNSEDEILFATFEKRQNKKGKTKVTRWCVTE